MNTDDNNACTLDACNTFTGEITNIVVNIDDGYDCTTDACDPITGISHIAIITNQTVTLTSRIFIQGYYLSSGLMNNCLYVAEVSLNPLDADTIIISIMNAAPPYTLVNQEKGILKTNGFVTVTFDSLINTCTDYYLKINHRNSIETWSKNPIPLSASTTYLFTSDSTQAYGDNEIRTSDSFYFAIYNGDVNQDGAIDGNDFIEIDGSIQAGAGGYEVADLNGDAAVDGLEFLIFDPNIQNGVGSVIP